MLRQRKLGEFKNVSVIRFRMQNRRYFSTIDLLYILCPVAYSFGVLYCSVHLNPSPEGWARRGGEVLRISSDTDDRSIWGGVEIFDSVYFFGWLG